MSHTANFYDEKAKTKPMKFSVTPTFRVFDEPTRGALPLREDIDMHVQLESIAEQRRNGCSQADWRVYVTTWATQETHEKFLISLLGETSRYCRQHGLYQKRRQILRSLLRRIDRDMADPDVDRYMTLASEIAGYGLFHLPEKAPTPPAPPSYRHRQRTDFPVAAARNEPQATMISIPTPDLSDALGAQRLDGGFLQTA